jgi:hypothetical protein
MLQRNDGEKTMAENARKTGVNVTTNRIILEPETLDTLLLSHTYNDKLGEGDTLGKRPMRNPCRSHGIPGRQGRRYRDRLGRGGGIVGRLGFQKRAPDHHG